MAFIQSLSAFGSMPCIDEPARSVGLDLSTGSDLDFGHSPSNIMLGPPPLNMRK
jgi:hypothetical protein